MRDIELLTLKAFLAALDSQPPLSEEEKQTIQDIFADLENRVGELHKFAHNSPNLQTPYKTCRQWLSQKAAERGVGTFALPDSTPEVRPLERENLVRPLTELDTMQETEVKEKTQSWFKWLRGKKD
ncbi:hypothetical protein PN462_13425 [Spirulina sp. CS-785/01]|uniref:hypothetical protein n=1 Tax=Spirulina sp. CS-785/01 TaxID=3021716 RepID=UPI00232BBEE6|nr:hypothetical protein [Spirulina sp. CS-785/01]MDB9314106.1 hypothetical protein [Spirulina sp. CS-785/01]